MVLPKVVTLSVQLADKASRTVALLTERLDQRRGRGQQQIMVKHVTVNADQQWSPIKLLAAEAKESTAALLTSGTERPMEILEPTHKEAVLVTEGQR